MSQEKNEVEELQKLIARSSMQKWNFKKREYKPFTPPSPEGNYKAYSDNMEEMVNCPHCDKLIPYGEGFTSRRIHTPTGFGYICCGECYEEEWDLARCYEKGEN